MPKRPSILEPIRFTDKEILAARNGNYAPVEKRMKKEFPARARTLKGAYRPHTKAELKRLAGSPGPTK